HARRLVPQHGRDRVDLGALGEVEVAVTHAGGDGADQDLVGTGAVDVDVLDLQGRGDGVEDGCLHVRTAASRPWMAAPRIDENVSADRRRRGPHRGAAGNERRPGWPE